MSGHRETFSDGINLEGKPYAQWTYGLREEAGPQNVRSVYWLCLLRLRRERSSQERICQFT